jgi:hypothetical protein
MTVETLQVGCGGGRTYSWTYHHQATGALPPRRPLAWLLLFYLAKEVSLGLELPETRVPPCLVQGHDHEERLRAVTSVWSCSCCKLLDK